MNNPFSYFIDSCANELDFLILEHAFEKKEPKIMPPECSIEYRKNNFVIDVIYEYGDFPWIRITTHGKNNSLDNIIKKKWPEFVINRKRGPIEIEERIDFVLEKYSKVLRKYTLEITDGKL